MTQDLIHYDVLTQQALRGLIQKALALVEKEGLPGDHHFYITFSTGFKGVDIGDDLLQRYPDDMTIVLEHQFWDLKTEGEAFEVTLKFGSVPKFLRIPYESIVRFHDPSVGFTLQFPSLDSSEQEQESKDTPALGGEPGEKDQKEETATADVVSLDSFRKK